MIWHYENKDEVIYDWWFLQHQYFINLFYISYGILRTDKVGKPWTNELFRQQNKMSSKI